MRVYGVLCTLPVPATMGDFWLPDTHYQRAEAPPAVGALRVGADGVLQVLPAEHVAQLPAYQVGVQVMLPGDGTVVLGNPHVHVLYVAMWDELHMVQVGRGTLAPLGRWPLAAERLPRRWALQAWCVAAVPDPVRGQLILGGAGAAA